MKYLFLLSVFFLLTSVSCKMDPPYFSYSNVTVDIIEKNIPENGTVNQPVIVSGICSAPNGCWSGLRFVFKKREDFTYDFYALGSYESYGMCPDVVVTQDTLISFTPEVAGEY